MFIIFSKKKVFQQKVALNDIVLHRENLTALLKTTLRVDGNTVYSVSGDGVILSTPTGSTAYNLSCNGPIVPPPAENIVVTPICHHSLIQKSIVLSPVSEVELIVANQGEGAFARLIVDGKEIRSIEEGDHIFGLIF